jgi:hypothetical protein
MMKSKFVVVDVYGSHLSDIVLFRNVMGLKRAINRWRKLDDKYICGNRAGWLPFSEWMSKNGFEPLKFDIVEL